MKKTFKNHEIIAIIGNMAAEPGDALKEKKLPVKLLYAIRRSFPALIDAYKPYEETLKSICERYDCAADKYSPSSEAFPKEMHEEVAALLNEEVSVDIHAVPEDVIEKCGEDGYDALSLAELDRLWWLVEDNKEVASED